MQHALLLGFGGGIRIIRSDARARSGNRARPSGCARLAFGAGAIARLLHGCLNGGCNFGGIGVGGKLHFH